MSDCGAPMKLPVWFDRALQSDHACAPALLLRARLERQAGRLEAAEHVLRTFPVRAEPALRASADYELGGILDRQGRYDEAMTAFLEAKALLQPLAARHAAELKIIPHPDPIPDRQRPRQNCCNNGSMPPASLRLRTGWPCWPGIRVPAPLSWNRCWMRTRTWYPPRRQRFFTMMPLAR